MGEKNEALNIESENPRAIQGVAAVMALVSAAGAYAGLKTGIDTIQAKNIPLGIAELAGGGFASVLTVISGMVVLAPEYEEFCDDFEEW